LFQTGAPSFALPDSVEQARTPIGCKIAGKVLDMSAAGGFFCFSCLLQIFPLTRYTFMQSPPNALAVVILTAIFLCF
jgi:hypothetical protein